MKLKKVVSLALAGVMAVSMLAGCGTKQEEPTQKPDDTEVVKTGYSAELEALIGDDKLDWVTFQDNSSDAAALQAMVAAYSDIEIAEKFVTGNVSGIKPTPSIKVDAQDIAQSELTKFMSDVNAEGYGFKGYFAGSVKGSEMNETPKAVKVYAVDGTVSMDQALSLVYNKVKSALTSKDVLLEEGVSETNSDLYYDYSYTVSVSVVSRTTTISSVVETPVKFVAVTVTRTGTPAHEA